ncbi:hypothetical protein [Maribacter aquivivus]|uniref:hypothetical protein n=1 Tax=Maribacter aquivivus TaxID=228958 RepID=UPI00249354CC|nr:hypothetical protein [Maribacter aquivivus]
MKQLYSLRKNFTIIGITGRVGAGCSEIANLLADSKFNEPIQDLVVPESVDINQLKINVCVNYLKYENNWHEFKVINYKDVLLLHLVYEAVKPAKNFNEAISNIIEIVCQNGASKNSSLENRFDLEVEVKNKILNFFKGEEDSWFKYPNESLTCNTLWECLADKKSCPKFYEYYFNFFEGLSKRFYSLLNSIDITKRTRLTHDLANNLRAYGSVYSLKENHDLNNIYTVAKTINRLIKNWKAKNEYTKIVIDSLKNSLELMFFKEKYSAFYTIATNKSTKERESYIREVINKKYKAHYSETQINGHIDNILQIDDSEYKGGEVNKGIFSSPDVENCIQKSDFHIFYSNKVRGEEDTRVLKIPNSDKQLQAELKNYKNLDLFPQLAKLIALIHQPGVITPTGLERTMQIAYNAKANSGCISRQVGAVVTDASFSVKAIGWNDIPRYQIPCNLRNANDLINGKNDLHFSEFEKGDNGVYPNGDNFKTKFTEEFSGVDYEKLEGRPCSFCFKTYHNAFEGEKNQVHTRSLHAEENAMLQITKYGGQGLKKGNLFTTASPCELCSKKAFQLGIKQIFYIDPYPGIATTHILTNSRKEVEKPKLLMFQGAVGKGFHKLYDPFLSQKDELAILANVKPKQNKTLKIENLTEQEDERDLIARIINDPEFKKKVSEL